MPYCEQCGREVTAGAKWCRHCGARQPTDEAAQPTAEPARPVEAAQAEVEPTRAGATETAPAQPLLRSTEPEAIPTRQSSGPGLAPRTETRIPVSTPAPLVQQLEVTRDSAWLAARDGQIVVGALFVVCFVITALVLVIASHGTGLGDWLRVGGWLTGMTLRGHLTGAATQAGPLGEVGTLAFQPGSLFAAAMALAAWRAARTERTRPSRTLPSLAAHAAITALTAAGVVAIIAVASRGQSSFSAGDQQFGGGGASLGVGVISAVFGTAVYVWLAATLGRIVGSGHRTVLTDPWRARLEAFSEPARRLGEFTAISGVAVCLLGIVALLAGHAAISVWLFALFTLPSLFLAGALTSWGAGWSFSASVGISSFGGSVGQTQGMLDGGVPAWF